MPDYGAQIADKTIANTVRKIHKVYQKAASDLRKELNDFTEHFAKQDKEQKALVDAGKITAAEYNAWRDRQIFRRKQWQDKLDQAVKIMNDANAEAVEVVKHGKLNVFAENYNYNAYQLEKKVKGAVNFNIYNEQTVARLVRKRPKVLPEWKINEKKDYIWNRRKVNNTVVQGIIEGKDIGQISKDLMHNLCTQNENKMRTFARTSITGAQNAGRQAQMEDAEDMGIILKKRWVATLDDRTRDLHADLDGQEVPVDEPFKVDGYEIDFPGDPSAEPEMVYNCRCTMIQVYEGIERHSVRRDMDDNMVEDMTYNEWKRWKEGLADE